ncbi:hypothetical protein ES332_D06G223900v1 [Gossypium tomentosum]|uniref:Phorbol-ester/DAG-type domain-containing protein n=1 Tax=Gossypium tomentosum TaxID=34277 RepID=A0A5D2KM69_GOSTO|nr:hypothetical protein ES332_D06G223900v1 [Gossypium tomentosum]
MKNENKSASHHKSVQQIQHPFHRQHLLVLVAEQSNEGLKAHCDGCGELLSAPCFTCIHCNYHLHKQCAEAPLEIPDHPLHPKIWWCSFSIDIKCAQLSSSFKFSQLSKHDIHKHPLTFIESPMAIDVLKKLNCCWCHEPLTDAIYLCPDSCFSFKLSLFFCFSTCKLHFCFSSEIVSSARLEACCISKLKSVCCCLFAPTLVVHHSSFTRNALMSYPLKLITLHIAYTLLFLTVVIVITCATYAKSNILDLFTVVLFAILTSIQGSFICDACGTEGNYTSCICLKCRIEVHKKCTSLPHIIKFSRHDHCIFHKHFLQTRELTRQDCKICFSEVKLDRGSYSCRKPGCNYVVYVNCVLEDYTLYEVIEDEKQFEELEEKSIQSSIILVIEVNEAGEATKIQHFSHQHCLVLADKMEEEIDRKCEGMPLFLHKTCAELPRIKQHWFHQSNATLKYFDRYKWCNFRRRVCTGLFYDIRGYWNMCLRCAKVSDIIECKGHQHFLFFYFKCKEKCNGCGTNSISNGAFRCGKCRFALVFRKVEGYPECSYCGKLCQEEILKCEKSTCNYIIHYECY